MLSAGNLAATCFFTASMDTPAYAWMSVILGAISLWIIWPARFAVGGTTLKATWWWAVATVVAVSLHDVAAWSTGVQGTANEQLVRYAVGTLSLCPMMSQFGAKRPQNGAWQFVVITLWAVLGLPAFEVWVRGRGEPLSIDPLRSWFLALLIAVGAINHVPTRFIWSAVSVAAAQLLLLWPQLPHFGLPGEPARIWVASLLFLIASISARRAAVRTAWAPRSHLRPLHRWETVWHDFHDWFGVVWGLRVMERINASAAMYRWPVTLAWHGFRRPVGTSSASDTPVAADRKPPASGEDAAIGDAEVAAIEQAFRSLLRRFVSAEWIQRRLEADGKDLA
jgi:hypothetical protein